MEKNDKMIELIYEAYPRKVGKLAALKAIRKAIKNADPNFLLERTKVFSSKTESWPKQERRFIPLPTTWFNQGRYYDDEQEWECNNTKIDVKLSVSEKQRIQIIDDEIATLKGYTHKNKEWYNLLDKLREERARIVGNE